jgi:hypothetical protein
LESPVDLDEASVIEEARRKAGVSDFGDESFRVPMRMLLASLDTEAALTPIGRFVQRQRIVDILVNRLRAEDHFRRHPGILAETITKPLVIVGLPRTGTTMLHRTLAADPRVYSALWYECRNPSPFPATSRGGRDPRIAEAEAQVKAMIEGSPELAAIHPLDALAPDEEILLLEHSFYSTTPEAAANVPSYGTWLDAQDQTPAYVYLKKLLQFLQWQKKRAGSRAERWALKTPHHLGFMDVLFEVFPDACVVQTHRDPLETIPSLASMIHAVWILASDSVDPREVGRQWNDKMATALKRCLRAREQHPDRFIDVWYTDAVKDPIGEVRRIYEFIGFPFPTLAENAMRDYVARKPREERPPHHYTLEQFGLTEASITRDFAEYRRRFILARGRTE